MGPNPPENSTTSDRSRAVKTASVSRWRLSPTTCCRYRSTPKGASFSAMNWALVFKICPMRSSVPTQMISAIIDYSCLINSRLEYT